MHQRHTRQLAPASWPTRPVATAVQQQHTIRQGRGRMGPYHVAHQRRVRTAKTVTYLAADLAHVRSSPCARSVTRYAAVLAARARNSPCNTNSTRTNDMAWAHSPTPLPDGVLLLHGGGLAGGCNIAARQRCSRTGYSASTRTEQQFDSV